ncbi:BnaC06g03230D [Brassica napus]|uniref:(rape) hypothetical protein n=1 Tax=Brassica napus TaxID=3708 RepID=A0A078GSM8_BRANA|nr:unnamed protein product [Brassica napus]CDY28142.1 BnaC06g03230D [Brassica napus]
MNTFTATSVLIVAISLLLIASSALNLWVAEKPYYNYTTNSCTVNLIPMIQSKIIRSTA